MKVKLFLLSMVILTQLFLSGCWDYSEYDDMVAIMTIGIDFNTDTKEMTVTVQHIPAVKGGMISGAESRPIPSQVGVVHSATDKTYYGALAKLQQLIPKQLFFGYLKIMIVGESAAKYKMKDIMELHDRTPAIRNSAFIAIVSGKAEDTISTMDVESVMSSGQEISRLINLSSNTGAAYPVTIQDFVTMMAIGGLEAVLPHITTTVYQNQRVEAKGGTVSGFKADEQREGDQLLSGSAAFKGNTLAGWMDAKESLGYGWITGKNIHAYETSGVVGGEDTEDIIYYRISKSKSKIKVQIVDGEPTVAVDVNVSAEMRKYYGNKGSEFLSPDELKTIQEALSDSIRSDIHAALTKAQKEFKSDIFGFGFALFRKNPHLWRTKYEKKWDDIFPDIPIDIKVDSKIINTGTNIKKLDTKK
jgi:spore germination protein KC